MDLALHHRTSPLFLNQGYPLLLEEEIEFSLSAAVEMRSLPARMESNQRPLQWKIEWEKNGNGRLTARFRAEMERGDLDLMQTTAFQAQLRALLQALSTEAILAPAPTR